MIQRIQSLYMLLSSVLAVWCLCSPLGTFFTEAGEPVARLHNLWMTDLVSHARDFSPWALFALLVIVATLTFLGIFLFRRRALQMRLLSLCIILLVGYYAFLGFLAYKAGADGLALRPTLFAAFPFVGIVLDWLAFRGILKDEMLVRSLDRLR